MLGSKKNKQAQKKAARWFWEIRPRLRRARIGLIRQPWIAGGGEEVLPLAWEKPSWAEKHSGLSSPASTAPTAINKLAALDYNGLLWTPSPLVAFNSADKSGLLQDTLHFTWTAGAGSGGDKHLAHLISRRTAAIPSFFRLIRIRFIVVPFFFFFAQQVDRRF